MCACLCARVCVYLFVFKCACAVAVLVRCVISSIDIATATDSASARCVTVTLPPYHSTSLALHEYTKRSFFCRLAFHFGFSPCQSGSFALQPSVSFPFLLKWCAYLKFVNKQRFVQRSHLALLCRIAAEWRCLGDMLRLEHLPVSLPVDCRSRTWLPPSPSPCICTTFKQHTPRASRPSPSLLRYSLALVLLLLLLLAPDPSV